MIRNLGLLAVLASMVLLTACWRSQAVLDDASPNNDASADSDTDTDTDTDVDSDTDTDTDTSVGTDTDVDTVTDIDSDTDTESGENACELGSYSGDVYVTTPAELEDLSGYTSVTGFLHIWCPSCLDLSPLICLTSVGDVLGIYDNDALSSVVGLDSLTSVGGNLSIAQNDILSDLVGLDSLATVGGEITISHNEALVNLAGLGALTEVSGDLSFSHNPSLANLAGLESLESIGGSLGFNNNDALTSIAALGTLTSVGASIGFSSNESLPSLTGLESITSVFNIGFYYNPSLTSLAGLDSLVSVDWLFDVTNNPGLTSLDGLDSLTSVFHEVEVDDNPVLPDCEVCQLLDQLTSDPLLFDVDNNLDDTCTPVPTNCPETDTDTSTDTDTDTESDTVTTVCTAGAVFINELHYDNYGSDEGERIELAGPTGASLTGWSIVLYNGFGGTEYETIYLSGEFPDQEGGMGTLYVPCEGIQNGAPDGIAVVDDEDTVVQLISYEGSFYAVDGPAAGMLSVDIGISESVDTSVGWSLMLIGNGCEYTDFSWTAGLDTFGEVNTSQTFIP